MSAGHLYGWDNSVVGAEDWVKVLCDADGYLKVDPTELFENPPTEDESKKAPSSEWAFDHKATPNAHHTPPVAGDFNHNDLAGIGVSDHHIKYTDADAKAAVGYNGTKYWSCPGILFDGIYPQTDNVIKNNTGGLLIGGGEVSARCSVLLPHGATVTGVILYGNAAIEDDSWYLKRITLSSGAIVEMASANFNSSDTSISYATIDNSLYTYFIYTTGIETDDEIYGARITYTL